MMMSCGVKQPRSNFMWSYINRHNEIKVPKYPIKEENRLIPPPLHGTKLRKVLLIRFVLTQISEEKYHERMPMILLNHPSSF
jgi:hypothetical protein